MQIQDPTSGELVEYRLADRLLVHRRIWAVLSTYKARRFARQSDWVGAASEYRAALRNFPFRARTWVQFGNALGKLGDIGGATAAYENAIRAEPMLGLGYKHLGIVTRESRRHEAAIGALVTALLLCPQDEAVKELLEVEGDSAWLEAKLVEAAFDLADKRRGSGYIGLRATVWRRAARRAARKKQWNVAERLYRKIISVRVSDVYSWIQLGHALNKQKKIEAAEDAFRQAVAINPHVADAWLQLGYTLAGQHKKMQADEAFAVVARLAPSRSKLHPFVSAQGENRRRALCGDNRIKMPKGMSGRGQAIWSALANHIQKEGGL